MTEAIRRLIEKWRERQREAAAKGWEEDQRKSDLLENIAQTYETCADELEAALAPLSGPVDAPPQVFVDALKAIGLDLFADGPTPQPDGTVDRYGCHWDVAPFTGCGAQGPTWETALVETLKCAMVLVEHLREPAGPVDASGEPACKRSPTGKHGFSEHEGARTARGTGSVCVWCGAEDAAAVPSSPAQEPK